MWEETPSESFQGKPTQSCANTGLWWTCCLRLFEITCPLLKTTVLKHLVKQETLGSRYTPTKICNFQIQYPYTSREWTLFMKYVYYIRACVQTLLVGKRHVVVHWADTQSRLHNTPITRVQTSVMFPHFCQLNYYCARTTCNLHISWKGSISRRPNKLLLLRFYNVQPVKLVRYLSTHQCISRNYQRHFKIAWKEKKKQISTNLFVNVDARCL